MRTLRLCVKNWLYEKTSLQILSASRYAPDCRRFIGETSRYPAETGERISGMIVEVEAYLGEIDKAAHSYNGRRTAETK